MKTLDQVFAKKVYDVVAEYATNNPEGSKRRKQYGSMAHRLPVLVHTAGLVQALAFVDDKGSDGQKDLLKDLADVIGLCPEETATPTGHPATPCDSVNALLEQSRTSDFQEYRFLTQQVAVALSWFKRYAQSVLKIEPNTGDE
jgi:CRISPR-associated protein Cmr5